MLDQALVGARVRQMRAIAGMSATDLAKSVSVSAGTLSMIENGRHVLSDALLRDLGNVLGCAPEFFGAPDLGQVSTRPWLRAYADASKRAVDRVIEDNRLAHQLVVQLELPRVQDAVPLFDGSLEDDDAIEHFALRTREAAGLEEGDVIRNVVRVAELLGCFVLPMEDELGRHLGLSQRIDAMPVIRSARTSLDPARRIPGDRQRFTVAHELGHLVLHHDCPAPDTPADATRYEKQAHLFAGALIAPAEPILADLSEFGGRVTLSTLSKLKQRWGLSVKAFVVRFRQLNLIDEAHARSLYKQISARGWNKAEPVEVPNESALWFSRALSSRLGAEASVEAQKRTGLNAAFFERWADWSPTPIPAQVVDLTGRHRERDGHAPVERPGSIARLSDRSPRRGAN